MSHVMLSLKQFFPTVSIFGHNTNLKDQKMMKNEKTFLLHKDLVCLFGLLII